MTKTPYPDDLLYTRDHEWARVEDHLDGQTLVTVGSTRFAVEQLGDVTQVELPKAGDSLKHAAVFGSVESVKAVSDLFAPLSGQVVKVNFTLSTSPEHLNDDPYDKGWMIQVAATFPEELSLLMGSDVYRSFLREQSE
jgi:glycine cleavage system H protein